MSDYRYVNGTLSPIDVYWPEESASLDDDLEELGFSLVCQLGLERNDDQGLWAQVYYRGRKQKRRIEGVPDSAQYAVMLGLCNEVRMVFVPDLPDLLKLLGELEPLIRLSLVTARMQAVYDACASMALCLPPPGQWRRGFEGAGCAPAAALAART